MRITRIGNLHYLMLNPNLSRYIEASETCKLETGLVEIKTESEEFFSNDQTETLHTEALEIKDEFMWTMKDFVSNNDPPKYIEQRIAPVHEKINPLECSVSIQNWS